jgi:hypothetical protein
MAEPTCEVSLCTQWVPHPWRSFIATWVGKHKPLSTYVILSDRSEGSRRICGLERVSRGQSAQFQTVESGIPTSHFAKHKQARKWVPQNRGPIVRSSSLG